MRNKLGNKREKGVGEGMVDGNGDEGSNDVRTMVPRLPRRRLQFLGFRVIGKQLQMIKMLL